MNKINFGKWSDGFKKKVEAVEEHNKSSLLLIFLLFSTLSIIYIPIYGTFSADSFGYYLLGDSIFKKGEYAANVVIDYYSFHKFPQPSRRFPPLYPFLIGLTDFITGFKIYSGVLLNMIIILCSFFAVKKLANNLNIKVFYGVFSFFIFCICDLDFVGEIIGGKSIPLSLFLLLVQINIILASRLNSYLSVVLISLLSGLLFFNRYDTLFYIMSIPFILFIIRKNNLKENIIRIGIYFFVIAVLYSPWGLRNQELYGQFLSSDNKLSAVSTYGNGTQICFWENGLPPTLFDDFSTWLIQRITYLAGNFTRFFLLKSLFLVPLFIVFRGYKSLTINQFAFLTIYIVYIIFNVGLISLTPFTDTRYFSIAYFSTLILVLITLNVTQQILSNSYIRLVLVAFVVNSILFLGFFLYNYKQYIWKRSESLNEKILAYVQKNNYDQKTVLVSHLYAEELNYYTGLKAIYPPRNRNNYLYNKDYEAWIRDWEIDIVVVDNRYKETFMKDYNYEVLDENYGVVQVKNKLNAQL